MSINIWLTIAMSQCCRRSLLELSQGEGRGRPGRRGGIYEKRGCVWQFNQGRWVDGERVIAEKGTSRRHHETNLRRKQTCMHADCRVDLTGRLKQIEWTPQIQIPRTRPSGDDRSLRSNSRRPLDGVTKHSRPLQTRISTVVDRTTHAPNHSLHFLFCINVNIARYSNFIAHSFNREILPALQDMQRRCERLSVPKPIA